ncbi:Hypp6472 [Branchiostoma lanceolatum]|nr:Hypp6472 [Branchiostoma lanceolatum]
MLEAGEPSGGPGPAQDDQNVKETYIDTLETILEDLLDPHQPAADPTEWDPNGLLTILDTIPNPQQGTQPLHYHLQQAAPVTRYRRIAPKPLPAAPPVYINLHSPPSTFVPLISPPATTGLIPHQPNGPIFPVPVMMGSFGGIHSIQPYHLNPPIAMASPRPIHWCCISSGAPPQLLPPYFF